MNRYDRAYRDPRSPLTPLTPLATPSFNFDSVGSNTPIAEPHMQRKNSFRGLKPSRLLSAHPQQQPSRRRASTPQRFSEDFMRTRSVFSPNSSANSSGSRTRSTISQDCTANSTGSTTGRNVTTASMRSISNIMGHSGSSTRIDTGCSYGSTSGREFKQGSPVEHPTLSPRVRSLLNRTGNSHLTELFTRQEIDIDVLIQMTLEDLEALGVKGAKELKLAMQVIQIAKKFFRK
ncbi:uncharacterized protein LOC115622895 [Scaptodrosophila lebanonensis]|uniref:Uncharacterized protein LOC115622895 n=1 Tax=Drosophila lebanonensis TaxID=7225 RepID=A0A6J2T7G3_DROLE|nr:uncharacterized protein LOC115622895 [Scaptodrosophila lebanonensis]